MIHVEENGLRTFEQHASAVAPRCIERAPCRAGVWQNSRRNFFQRRQKRRRVDRSSAATAAKRIMVREKALELVWKRRKVGKIDDAQSAPSDLVFVGRTNAAHRRADALQAVRGFA